MHINWKRVAWWATLWWLVYTAPTEGKGEVDLWVYPKTSFCMRSPCFVRTVVTVPRHPDNRHLVLAWGSETGQSGSSFYQLDGERAPAKFDKHIEVSIGSYLISACVYRVPNERLCDREEVEVNGGEF